MAMYQNFAFSNAEFNYMYLGVLSSAVANPGTLFCFKIFRWFLCASGRNTGIYVLVFPVKMGRM